jgi:hypothetical protein
LFSASGGYGLGRRMAALEPGGAAGTDFAALESLSHSRLARENGFSDSGCRSVPNPPENVLVTPRTMSALWTDVQRRLLVAHGAFCFPAIALPYGLHFSLVTKPRTRINTIKLYKDDF